MDDAGTWTCTGEQPDGQKEPVDFTVTVKEKPKWISPSSPSIVNGVIGLTDVTVVCKARGDPEPEVTFYVNAVKITGSTTKLTLDKTAGSITLLKLDQMKVVQCIARNEFGNNSKSSAIKLWNAPLTWSNQSSPAVVHGTNGTNVTIVCKASGDPKPEVTFHVDNVTVTGSTQHLY